MKEEKKLFNLDYFSLLLRIADLEEQNERLNNIISTAISAINTYQNEKTLSLRYEDIKRIRGILKGNDFDIKMFEEYLKELKEENDRQQ